LAIFKEDISLEFFTISKPNQLGGEFGWWLKARRAVYKGGVEAAGGMRLSASVGWGSDAQ